MKTVQISNLPGIEKSPDKSKIAKAIYEALKRVAADQKARLGKFVLVRERDLQFSIANDSIFEQLKEAAEKAGLKIAEVDSVGSLVSLCDKLRSEAR